MGSGLVGRGITLILEAVSSTVAQSIGYWIVEDKRLLEVTLTY